MNPLLCQSINRKIKFQFEDRVQTKTIPSIQFIRHIRYPGFQVLFIGFKPPYRNLKKKIWIKKLSLYHKHKFYNPYILVQLSLIDLTELMFEISKVYDNLVGKIQEL